MATVLEEYSTEEHRFVIRFLWVKGPNEKDIHKEISGFRLEVSVA
jgi:hypothetical protein